MQTVRTNSGTLATVPSSGELAELERAGRLPWPVSSALTLADACAVVTALPPPRPGADGLPVGYGLLPPRAAEPAIRTKKRTRDGYGRSIPAGVRGMVGALWNRNGRAVVRLWFRALDEGGHQGRGLRGPVDGYADDLIGSVMGLEGVVPQFTGWEIVRLDSPA